MVAATVPRMSARFRVFGYVMVLAGLFIVLLGTGRAMLPVGGGGGTGRDAIFGARDDAVLQLRQLDGMLDSFVADFEADGTVSEVALTQLPDNDRVLAESILGRYETSLEAAGASDHVPTTNGDVVIAIWVVGLPLVGVGGFLALNKKVWECRSCGFISEA